MTRAATVTYYLGGTRPAGGPSDVSLGEAKAFSNDPAAFPVQYPRDLAPLIGSKTLDQSVAEGRAALHSTADPVLEGGTDDVRVVGVSQGALIAQQTKKDWATTSPASDVSFLTFGDPTNTDGGLMTKIPTGIALPGLVTPVTADDQTPFDTTTVAIEYDIIADAPDKPNPVSWANAVLGGAYYHHTYTGEMADRTTGIVKTEETNAKGGVDTHILVKTPQLPLVQPLRDMGVNENLVKAIEKPLKKVVDAGYTGDRGNEIGTTIKPSVTPNAGIKTGNKVKPRDSFAARLKAEADKHPKITFKPLGNLKLPKVDVERAPKPPDEAKNENESENEDA